MARTTSSAVQTLLRAGSLGGDYDDVNSPSLTPHIDSATAIVDRVATCATAKGKTLTAAELELIERWLSAHFYVTVDQTLAESKTADASAVFHGRTGMNFESTRYGQNALSIDYSGCLAAIGKRQVARMFWAGRRPSEQTDYIDRD